MDLFKLNLKEADVVRLILEFLNTRELHITQLSLERETGVINSNFPNDVIFLRQLILDGQWDDVLEFIQPLSPLEAFDIKKFHFIILRQKVIELLFIRSELQGDEEVRIVREIVKILDEVEKIAPSKEDHSKLCFLLALPSIYNHEPYKNWNPSNARVQCFQEVYPLVEHFMTSGKPSSFTPPKSAKNDRLMQLIIKGILYESCVSCCQSKASGTQNALPAELNFSQMLDVPAHESNLSLLSWLQAIPVEMYSIPFEQRSLHVVRERLERPLLHTSWTEHMLVTPIKPLTFPHVKMVFRRPQSAADAMSRSLRPLPDGASRPPAAMAQSAIDCAASAMCAGPTGSVALSSSYSGFHLTGMKDSKLMNTSVDKLFEVPNSELNRSYACNDKLQPIQENAKVLSDTVNVKKIEPNSIEVSNVSTPEHHAQDYSTTTSASIPAAADQPLQNLEDLSSFKAHRRDLLKEYQLQKQREHDDYLLKSSPQNVRNTTPQAGDAPTPRDFDEQCMQHLDTGNLALNDNMQNMNRQSGEDNRERLVPVYPTRMPK